MVTGITNASWVSCPDALAQSQDVSSPTRQPQDQWETKQKAMDWTFCSTIFFKKNRYFVRLFFFFYCVFWLIFQPSALDSVDQNFWFTLMLYFWNWFPLSLHKSDFTALFSVLCSGGYFQMWLFLFLTHLVFIYRLVFSWGAFNYLWQTTSKYK